MRQSIKFSGIQTGRNQKVACTFRRRCRQNRSLIFGKSLLAHKFARTLNHCRTQQNIFMNTVFAQIQKTIFQTNFFRSVVLHRHLKRQNLGTGINLDSFNLYFNIAGRHILIHTFAGNHFSFKPDNRFNAQTFNNLKQIRGAVKNTLSNAVMISQIDKAQVSQVAFTMNPTPELNCFANIGSPKLSACMCSIALHF